MEKLIFVIIILLLFICRIREGYLNGMMEEIVTILSGAIALVSVGLVFFAITSYREKAISVLVLCVIGLIVLGVVFKLCSLIFRPILALSKVSVIGMFNRVMGAVLGAVEAVVLSYLFYRIYDYILDYLGRVGL